MVKKLHVGNLSYSVTDEDLKNAFSACGSVESATVVKDKRSGRSKGFGFVEMKDESEANQAIEKLNRTELNGRMMFVSESNSTSSSERPAGRPTTRRPGFGHRVNRSFDRK